MIFSENGRGMPGPAMASRMMQMMPMMASQMLSDCAGEDRKEFLAETVKAIVTRATEGMTNDEYNSIVEHLHESLVQRSSEKSAPEKGCC
jgi:hypothetical protein